MILLVSGGRGAVNQLAHDWLYSNTGVITNIALLENIFDRVFAATVLTALGIIAIVIWSVLKSPS